MRLPDIVEGNADSIAQVHVIVAPLRNVFIEQLANDGEVQVMAWTPLVTELMGIRETYPARFLRGAWRHR